MSRTAAILITGCNGGIGQALCQTFSAAGYATIGTDIHDRAQAACDHYVQCDLSTLCDDPATQAMLRDAVLRAAAIYPSALTGVINNAAVQVTAPLASLDVADFVKTQKVNAVAPFILAKLFEQPLRAARGTIVNIGSIHSRLTKPGFAAYSTSKAALAGLTRALALEFGSDVTVNSISPAATRTEMLLDGFRNSPEKYDELASFHPAGRIGDPREVAELALFLFSPGARFITGADLAIDGGIAGRLHDPD
jgi:NAD(P)-dependent dehydrogenase (short-subunit alcohol dehydrogenase family)